MAARPEVVSSLEAFIALRGSPLFRNALKGGDRRVGLVATMGALHRGHTSLMTRAAAENDVVVATIFVNPTQFGPNEDLARYPRTLEKDVDLIAKEGARVDVVFAPGNPAEIYPPGFSTRVDVAAMDATLEGKARPGHFSGVTTVVAKLFNIIRPTNAYFGQKDAMQCVAIKRLVRDLNFPVNVVIGDTVREADGLAMSSRNMYLSPVERRRATVLYRALSKGKDMYLSGERRAEKIISAAQAVLDVQEDPPIKTQYLSLADAAFGNEVQVVDSKGEGGILSGAILLGSTRLIDNVLLPGGLHV